MAENPGVGKKIGELMKKEGKPRKQAIATAISMNESGRLTKRGSYIPKGSTPRKSGRR